MGTVPQWAAFILSTSVIITTQIVLNVRSKTSFKNRLDNTDIHLATLDNRCDKMDGKISDIKKTYVSRDDYKEVRLGCRSEFSAKTEHLSHEFDNLRDEIRGMRKDIKSIGSLVDQLVALQTGKVQ